jgi:CHAD domain-containing protein
MAKPKPIRGINCDAAAATAIRLVVSARVGEMCALREKALDWGDPEGVHDMRVASRRLRSALNDFIPYLRKRRLSASLRGIKAIADALGEVRDQDVAIIALDKLATNVPPEVSSGIQALANIRRTKRDEARAQLTPILDQDLVAQLRSEFLKALDEVLTPPQGGKRSRQSVQLAGSLSYREIARATILDRLKEFEKLSDSLYRPLKAKPLHRMRIAAKRLRYALELFGQCWGKPVALFARRVAALQSELGELHDCDIWIVDSGQDLAKAQKRATAGSAPEDEDRSVALLWLLSHFVKLRTKHFRKALVRWREWEANDFSGQLRNSIEIGPSVAAITTGEATIAATETAGVASAHEV